ncbi:MAG: hypothetical protein ACO3A2_07890 [Bdellovibrionia bacterium]
MSFYLRFLLKVFALVSSGILCVLFDLEIAHARSATEALKARDQAFHQYYSELNKLGDSRTPEKINQLKKTLLEPAILNYASSMNEKYTQFYRQAQSDIASTIFKSLSREFIPKSLLGLMGSQPEAGSKGSSADSLNQPDPQDTETQTKKSPPRLPQSPRAETILDGSQIPKEIEFEKPKKNRLIPDPSPSTTSPETEVKGNGTTEVLEFPGSKKTPPVIQDKKQNEKKSDLTTPRKR